MVPRLWVAAITAGRLLAYTYTYMLYSHAPTGALNPRHFSSSESTTAAVATATHSAISSSPASLPPLVFPASGPKRATLRARRMWPRQSQRQQDTQLEAKRRIVDVSTAAVAKSRKSTQERSQAEPVPPRKIVRQLRGRL